MAKVLINGFAQNSSLVTNLPNTVSVIGELSQLSKSLAVEVGEYIHTDGNTKEVVLHNFSNPGDNTLVQLPSTVSDHILTVCRFVYTQITSGGTLNKDTLRQLLTTVYAGNTTNFVVGDIVLSGTNSAPKFISWENTTIPELVGTDGNAIKVWFVDSALQNEYSSTFIKIVAPVANIDSFFASYSNVQTAVRSDTTKVDRIEIAKDNKPYTFYNELTFNYIAPNNAGILPTVWTALVYGKTGNNSAKIIEAIKKFILANTARTELEWSALFPDIFFATEFTFIPMWTRYAIPNRELQAGVYLPFSIGSTDNTYVKSIIPYYLPGHIDTNLSFFTHPYKSVSVAVIGKPTNLNRQFKLFDLYPDFINVPSTFVDFSRMSQTTQNFSIVLSDAIILAESVTPDSAMSGIYSKVVRENKLFVQFRFYNVDYFVYCKWNER